MKLALKLISFGFIFALPIGIIFYNFKGEPVEVIENTIGFVPTLMLFIIGTVAVYFVFSIIRSKIYNDPTGKIAIAFYSLVLLTLFGVIYALLGNILTTAESQFEAFKSTIQLYMRVSWQICASVFIGFVINGLQFIKLKGE